MNHLIFTPIVQTFLHHALRLETELHRKGPTLEWICRLETFLRVARAVLEEIPAQFSSGELIALDACMHRMRLQMASAIAARQR